MDMGTRFLAFYIQRCGLCLLLEDNIKYVHNIPQSHIIILPSVLLIKTRFLACLLNFGIVQLLMHAVRVCGDFETVFLPFVACHAERARKTRGVTIIPES